MDKYNTEIFGEFTYAESITYEDLLRYETILLKNLEEILADGGAEHLDFTPLGDTLMFQCAFITQNLEILRDMSDEICALLPEGVRGKLMCLQKSLTTYHLFWLKRGQWQEKEFILPWHGPDDAPVHKVEVIEETQESGEGE